MTAFLDKDIREPLFDFLEENFGKTRIIEEKNIGDSRADVIMVTENGLYGIEDCQDRLRIMINILTKTLS